MLHAGLAQAALAAGKHTICQKPLAPSLDSARKLEATATRTGLVAAVRYHLRYLPMLSRLRELVASAELGDVHLIHGHFLLDELLRAGEDHWMRDRQLMGPSLVLADVGSPLWDLVEHLTGSSVAAAVAAGSSVVSADLEDTAVLLMRLRDGQITSAAFSQVAAGHTDSVAIEVVGTNASVTWQSATPELLEIRRQAPAPRGRRSSPAPPADRWWTSPSSGCFEQSTQTS